MADCNNSQHTYKWCLQEVRSHKVWPVAQVAELHHARYLLQPRALELFLYNHSSALLSFETPKVSYQSFQCDHHFACSEPLPGLNNILLMMKACWQAPSASSLGLWSSWYN